MTPTSITPTGVTKFPLSLHPPGTSSGLTPGKAPAIIARSPIGAIPATRAVHITPPVARVNFNNLNTATSGKVARG